MGRPEGYASPPGQPEVEMSNTSSDVEDPGEHIQHISNVLGDALYSRQRRKDACFECWTQKPHPLFNFTSLGLGCLLILLLVFHAHSGGPAGPAGFEKQRDSVTIPQENSTSSNDAPEGGVTSTDFALTHDYRGKPRRVEANQGVVAADHGRCSDIGRDVLQAGGTAVDSAVATALCQGIMSPSASGIGGGTFMVIRTADGVAEIIDAREVAPAGASQTMFDEQSDLSLEGGLAVAVPLELKGLFLAHQRFGSMDWEQLVLPAAALARSGFPAHPYLVTAIGNSKDKILRHPALRDVYMFPEGDGWRAPKVNETCCQRPKLAELLEDVAQNGPDVLYTGEWAQGLVDDVRAAGGVLSLEDLSSAEAVVKEPLRAQVWGLELIAPPPPSSAATVMMGLQILAGFALPMVSAGTLGTHHQVEAMKHAFALRMALGDPGKDNVFMDVGPILADMLSPEFAASLRANISDDHTQNYTEYGGRWNVANGVPVDDHGTSHISIVDSLGGAVSMTTTVNTGFGSAVISPSTGILLNNQMDDFSKPKASNVYGLPPSRANFIAPGKKPMSSMSPTIVTLDGRLRAVVGASGGPRIISAVFQTLIRLVALGQDPLDAVSGPRLHHQLIPHVASYEHWSTGSSEFAYSPLDLKALKKRGHNLTASDWGSVTQAIVVDPTSGMLVGVSDPRKDGAPAGF